MNHSFSVTTSLLALCLPLSAQTVQISGKTTTILAVHADGANNSGQTQQWPAATVLPAQFSVSKQDVLASAKFSSTIGANEVVVRAESRIGNTRPAISRAGCFSDAVNWGGRPDLRFVFRSSTPVAGRIVLRLDSSSATGNGWFQPHATCWASVGNNGLVFKTPFENEPVVREYGVTLDANGIAVDLSPMAICESQNTWMQAMAEVRVTFIPGPQVTSYGFGCDSLVSSFPQPGKIKLGMQGNSRNGQAFFALGTTRLDVTLPLTGCRILQDCLVVLPLGPTNGATLIERRFDLPSGKLSVLAQGFTLETGHGLLHATQGLHLQLN